MRGPLARWQAMQRLALAAASLALCTGALAAAPEDLASRRKQLNELLAEQWEHNLKVSPEFASILGDKRYNDQLSDFSEKAIQRELAESRKYLARFEAVDTAGFPEQEALNKALMVRQLKEELEGARFKDWEMPVTQFGGLHINAPQLVSILSFETVKDYDDYIARLNKLPLAFQQITGLMRKGMAEGLMPPRLLLEQVAQQSGSLSKGGPSDSPFFEPLRKLPKSFSDADKERLQLALIAAIRDHVLPAYQAFTKFVADEYAPRGRKEPGLWALPDGDARYAFAVKQSTTTELTPDQIHQIGLREVARDQALMLAIAKKMGAADQKAFETSIKDNPKLHPKSRQEMLDLYRRYNDQMWAKAPQLFGRLPKAKVEVMPVEAFREKNASGAQYVLGTPDGKRPGHIMVNTSDFAARTTINIETTSYHEGFPGHHLQLTIAQELEALPAFRQHGGYTAYVEGWGLYAERLGEDVGFYQDPYSMYGHLQDDLLRAIRLVVDTGYHSKHWTRQQVVDYFHEHSGIDEVEVQSETDRYSAWPAQALGYKMGQLKLLELRARAKEQLGDGFDLRGFHDEVLGAGALPLDVLQARVESWIAAHHQQPASGRATGSHTP